MKEKPRILVSSRTEFLSSDFGCFYLEVYSDGYNYYHPDGKLHCVRSFTKEPSGWSLSVIEHKIKRGDFIEYTGEKAQAFLAEQVLRR